MVGLNTDILIVGAGPVGSTLAGLLGQAGIECDLLHTGATIPAREAAVVDPRALAITHASARILRSFGLWQQLPRERIGYFQRMYVWDENSKGEVEFNAASICESTLGYIIEQSVIQAGLDNILDLMPAVSVHHGVSVMGLTKEDEQLIVALDDGRRIRAKLVVAADGVQSTIRGLAGIDYKTRDYAQQAVACVVNTVLPHQHVARQRFLSHGPLAFLPMSEPDQCGIVWSTTPEHARQLLAMEDELFNVELQSAFDSTLGDVTACGPRVAFPLKRAQAEHYCQPRLALIGDAAHCVHPLAGQGANLGLLDAASLFEIIQTAIDRKRDVGSVSVLRRYQRWRKGENYFMMMVFEGFKTLFEMQNTPFPLLRESGMTLFNNMEPLKQRIMKRAMGLDGDLPEVARA